MILVFGGRSKIGSALLESLVADDQRVRAAVREGQSTEGIAAGVEVVSGDLADPGSLAEAMVGAEKVFLLSSPDRDAFNWHRNAIDAARDAGVGLLVRSSILGADQGSSAEFINTHARCDRYLEQSGLDYVILRPNLFLQNIPESTIPSIGEDGNFYVNAADARISMVDTRDVAEVAAVTLTQPGHAGARYNVTGPQALSYDDVAAELSQALGREVTYVDAPDEAVRQALLSLGVDEWLVAALAGLYQDYRRSGTDGYAAQVSDTVDRLTGRPARSLDELLRELATDLA
jgi:uncharacterized protein YbjT (DUF2867 family)